MCITFFKVGFLVQTIFVAVFLFSGCGEGKEADACSAVPSHQLRIAGGNLCSSSPSTVPLIVTVLKNKTVEECTGSYVSPTDVLTAAHCLTSKPRAIIVASRNTAREAVQYHIHSLYDGSENSPFDIAIIKVDESLNNTEPVPILLSSTPRFGEEVVIYGYGVDEKGYQGIDRVEEGKASLKATYATFTGYKNQVLVVHSTGMGTICEGGDIGGPVLVRNSLGQYGIVGITISSSPQCDLEKGRSSSVANIQSKDTIDFIKKFSPDFVAN